MKEPKEPCVMAFLGFAEEMIEHEMVLSMKAYIQHSNVDCYEHSVFVAYSSYCVAAFINPWLRIDLRSVVRGAMLHDFFLYDWHHPKTEKERFFEKHGFTHPRKAFENASRYFEMNKTEEDIILKHMWPLNLAPPRTREALLVTLVDKYCSLKEVVMPWTNVKLKNTVRYICNKK